MKVASAGRATPPDDIANCFRQWWLALQPREVDTQRAEMGPFADQLGRAERAKLRRGRSIDELLGGKPTVLLDRYLLDGYRKLIGIRSDADEKTSQRLSEGIALAAGVLAHVTTDIGRGAAGPSLASLLGQKIGDRRRMSELRFRNLQEIRALDELLLLATRAVALAGGTADVGRLGKDLILWADELERPPVRPAASIRYQWARDYYLATAKDIATDDAPPAATEQPSA